MLLASPIAANELRRQLRAGRSMAFLIILLAAIGTVFIIFWQEYNRGANYSINKTEFSRNLFLTLTISQIVAFGILAPLLTAGAITGERERRTLELLQCSGFSSRQIIWGKWFSSIAFMTILMFSLLPLMMLTLMIGGVAPMDFVVALLVIGFTMANHAAIGLAFSACARRTLRTTAAALIAVIALNALLLQTGPIPVLVIRFVSGSTGGNFLIFLFIQVVIFVMTMALAASALDIVDPFRPPDNPEDLQLIKPRPNPPPFPDDRNPVHVLEQRRNRLSVRRAATAMTIAVSLIVLFFIFVDLRAVRDDDFVRMVSFFCFLFVLLRILAVAALPVSRERDEETMDLLLITPLPPHRIVMGKYLSLLIPHLAYLFPLLALCIVHAMYDASNLAENLLVLAAFSAFIVLYLAIGIFCSSRCRRNASAITSTVLAILACAGLPFIMIIVYELSRNHAGTDAYNFTALFSPVAQALILSGDDERLAWLLAQLVLNAAATLLLLNFAIRAIAKPRS